MLLALIDAGDMGWSSVLRSQHHARRGAVSAASRSFDGTLVRLLRRRAAQRLQQSRADALLQGYG